MTTGPSCWVRISEYTGPTDSWSTARCHIADMRAPARSNTLPAMAGLVCTPFTTISAKSRGTLAFFANTGADGNVSWIRRSAPSHASTSV